MGGASVPPSRLDLRANRSVESGYKSYRINSLAGIDVEILGSVAGKAFKVGVISVGVILKIWSTWRNLGSNWKRFFIITTST